MGTPRFLTAALLLAGCATAPAAPGASLIGAWTVESFGGAPTVGAAPLTVEFDETHRVFGSSGCNRYTGAYSHDSASGALTMTPLGVTRRACIDPALMAQEQRLIDALQRATRAETRDGAVTLIAPGAEIALKRRTTARRAAPAPAAVAVAATSAAPPAPSTGAPLTPARAPPPSTSTYALAGAPASPAPTATPSVTPAAAPAPLAIPAPASAPAPIARGRIAASGLLALPDGATLPAGATVRVQLRDVSRAGAPATVIGQQDLTARAAPLAFSVEAPASVIGPNARLTLVAQVLAGERLYFITDTANPVPVGGASGMSVRLAPAARMPSSPALAAAPVTPDAPRPAPLPALSDVPEAAPWRCRGETLRIAFEDHEALLTTADGAVARLARIDADEDGGAPQMYSNSLLTVIREHVSGAVRFARGRAALTTCTPG